MPRRNHPTDIGDRHPEATFYPSNMDKPKFWPVDGRQAGGWVAERISGGPGPLVKELVPSGYDGYLRIFHPAHDPEGRAVTWASIACDLGQKAHRQMQWHSLIGADRANSLNGSRWRGNRPRLASLDIDSLSALCEILSRQTAPAEAVIVALSTIHSDVDIENFPKPLLRLPHRDYMLLSGHVADIAIDEVALVVSPNMIWASDHSWFVASECDFDSTLVGGNEDLIRLIDDSDALETEIIFPSDSLAEDSDSVNASPASISQHH
jgi:hypothetical protein